MKTEAANGDPANRVSIFSIRLQKTQLHEKLENIKLKYKIPAQTRHMPTCFKVYPVNRKRVNPAYSKRCGSHNETQIIGRYDIFVPKVFDGDFESSNCASFKHQIHFNTPPLRLEEKEYADYA